jgi:hypothetical protein
VSTLWEKTATGGPACSAWTESGQCIPNGAGTQGGPACHPMTEAGGCQDPDG